MSNPSEDPAPHSFWQEIHPAGTFAFDDRLGYEQQLPVGLPDGSELVLPIRLRDGGETALASLIINQASFEVLDHFSDALAANLAALEPEVIVGLPTLGLTLAAGVARSLGHARYVPLGTSRKFWYEEALSVPMRSITSPDQEKRLYLDPRMLPLLSGKRVVLIDDVLSSGTSILAGIRLLASAGIEPVAIGAAMLQTMRWASVLEAEKSGLSNRVTGVIRTPRLLRNDAGRYVPEA